MSSQPTHLAEEPTELSISLLVRSLKRDSATKGVSPRNYAHRSRVIRQQKDLLARKTLGDADEINKQSAKRLRKTSRAPDHREEGGQG